MRIRNYPDDAEVIEEFEHRLECEMRNIKRLLDEMRASKLLKVSIVETTGIDDDNAPVTLTLRIDLPDARLKGAARGRHH